MNKQNKKIKEPFDPEKTPKPPQIIDPNSKQKKENPIENKGGAENANESAKKASEPAHRQHLLSDDADIDDETTV